jgi:hypothetical protein
MKLNERIQSIAQWGDLINAIPKEELTICFRKAENANRWFTPANCFHAVQGILPWLNSKTLLEWTSRYEMSDEQSGKTVGLVMAGNIPLVGFHDLLCVLISGHGAKIKLSSQDEVLLPYLTNILISIDERWRDVISFESRLNNVEAVIATGSDNSSRYFEYYFKNIPKIIRRNRTSVGILIGEESPDELQELGKDIFTYFGLGCRNVSKIFVPENFDFDGLTKSFSAFQDIINHNKYGNNYDYQKAIRLISGKKFLDAGFFLIENSTELVSPISVLYYETYSDQDQLKEMIKSQEEKIQCVLSAKGWWKGSVPFGQAQNPSLFDYADNVDTMKFLTQLE